MAGKRSSAVTAAATKKARKVDDSKRCLQIEAALQLAAGKGMPEEVLMMLSMTLKHSLTTLKEDRHPFQSQFVEMVGKSLSMAEEFLTESVAAAEAVVNNGDTEKLHRETAVKEAEETYSSSKEAHRQKQLAKNEAAEAFQATIQPLKDAIAHQKDGDSNAVALDSAKASLDKALADLLAPLKAEGGKQRQLQALSKALHGLDGSLLEAMLLPLAKNPEQRGSFDMVILEQLDQQIAAKVAGLEDELAQAAPAREQRAAAVKAVQEAHDAAKSASDLAVGELKSVKDFEAAAKSALGAAKEAIENFAGELEKAANDLDKARAKLANFRSGALATFNEFRERISPAPPADEPAPAAEEPATANASPSPPAEEPASLVAIPQTVEAS